MTVALCKSFLPDRSVSTRIVRGPFRGAAVVMNPRTSLRKICGLYERELNPWLEEVLPRVVRVLDVGANDGYFTFGCAAAFRRLGRAGEIIAFEPQQELMDMLRESVKKQPAGETEIVLCQASVGTEVGPGITTLDAVRWNNGDPEGRTGALVKIDVGGAELEVVKAASSWLNSGNYFVIEVHEESIRERIVHAFSVRGLKLNRLDQRPLPFIGHEMRSERNWWLVSDLAPIRRENSLERI